MQKSWVPITPESLCLPLCCQSLHWRAQTAAVEFQKAGPRHGWEKSSWIRKACFCPWWDETEGAHSDSLKECWEVDLFAYFCCSCAKRAPGKQREMLENTAEVATAMTWASGDHGGGMLLDLVLKGELVSPEFPISWLTVNARNLWPPGDTFGQVRSRSKDRKDTYRK